MATKVVVQQSRDAALRAGAAGLLEFEGAAGETMTFEATDRGFLQVFRDEVLVALFPPGRWDGAWVPAEGEAIEEGG